MKRREFIKSVAAVSAANALLNASMAMALDDPETSRYAARPINLRPQAVTQIMAEFAVRTPGLSLVRMLPPRMQSSGTYQQADEQYGELPGSLENAVCGFNSPQESVTWTVNAPESGDYVVGVIFSAPDSQQIEVRCGVSALAAPSLPRTWDGRPFYWRQQLPGVLRLKAGENRISFRLPAAKPAPAIADDPAKPRLPGVQLSREFSLWSIELGTPAASIAQLNRAKQIRGDCSWMIAGKYGQFIHWSPLGYPFYGDQPRWQWHQKAVEIFDVNVFADAVERTGAAWIVFTMTHGKFYWPGPNSALDAILPGRTAERDLPAEIIAELKRRGIRTLFYLHNCSSGIEDPAWANAVGALNNDQKRFGDNIEKILRESSLRYGTSFHGYGYYDGAFATDYPLDPPWERWARAIKAGNPSAVVGFSCGNGTTVSPFTELAVDDGGATLIEPDRALIGPGRQLGDVTPAWWCLMDSWIFRGPMNGKIGDGPKHPAQDYVNYFKQMAEAKIPVTINLILTADVTRGHPLFNEQCMAVMEQVRKAIRGA
jgi:hypothetical protein